MEHKKTFYIINNFIIYPIIFYLIAYLVINGYGFMTGIIGKVFFPRNASLLELTKIFITTSLIMVTIEYFYLSEIPSNYFISRMIGVLFMISSYLFLSFFKNATILEIIIIVIISLFLTVFIQRQKNLRYGNYIGLLVLFILLEFLIVIY